MSKARVTVTVTREVDLDEFKHYYPATYTKEELLQEEINFASDAFLDWAQSEEAVFSVKGELIE